MAAEIGYRPQTPAGMCESTLRVNRCPNRAMRGTRVCNACSVDVAATMHRTLRGYGEGILAGELEVAYSGRVWCQYCLRVVIDGQACCG
jgi:hypothetical protein